jgi:hypothetical protein
MVAKYILLQVPFGVRNKTEKYVATIRFKKPIIHKVYVASFRLIILNINR